jgi:trypsin-like peptidase
MRPNPTSTSAKSLLPSTKPSAPDGLPVIEPLFLAAARVNTFLGQGLLTNASGFFFQRDERLFLITSRHVMIDEPTRHFPDRIEIELHVDPANMAQSTGFSMPLYQGGKSVWKQGEDTGGDIDVAVLEIQRGALPKTAVYRAFTPEHLCDPREPVEIGSPLLVVGFPLGFHDALHHLPVVRHAVNASPFGLRFQGKGYFLTDARTHRGTSGAPVVMRARGLEQELADLPWMLLGVHSSRMDVGTRDLKLDEALGLNCAWYADILLTLTEH